MELQPYEFRDPASLIDEVARRVPLRPGDVYVVLVKNPSTDQHVEGVVLLGLDAVQDDWQHAEDELARVMSSLPVPPGWPPSRSVMTVVVREGRTVRTGPELGWMTAWRYCNHFRDCHDGDLMLVTEHGWYDVMTGWGAATPAAA